MAKAKKNTKKKKVALAEDEREELKAEGELPKKSVVKSEERQLLWFFIIAGVILAAVLISYFGVEGAKTFEYGGVNWVIEEYAEPTGTIYHGQFGALDGANLIFNVYLRGDPRENDVKTEGTFDKFKYGGIVSMSPAIDACRGELSRVMLDLGSFLKRGVGVGPLETGSIDENVANESGRRYALCDNVDDRTVVIVDIGEPAVIQDVDNPECYTIYAETCNDVSSVEKFILKSVEDFGRKE